MSMLNSPTELVKSPSTPTITTLQAEISTLRLKQRSLDGRRREALNKILDIKGSTRVFCRVCSSNSFDHNNSRSPISVHEENITVKSVGGIKKEFTADKVFSKEATQEDIFKEVDPVLRSALHGHNVCIFAYGQTGTGKTHTMEGISDQPGIVPRSIEELFHRVSQEKSSSFTFSISMLEIYMGSIRDLLTKKKHSSSLSSHKCGLNILSKNNGSVEIEHLTDVVISDFKQAYRFYVKGKRARATSWTNVNDASSRSHCLTRITIRSSEGKDTISKLWMVDLGGSERLQKTGAIGQTLDEGKAINLSLSALGDVIASLKKKRNHIPYRNSKLTQILSDSLGDGSRVLMIVHVSPSENDVGETICSLSFAKRVRAIENNREVSEELKNQKEKCISELDQQIKDTEIELQKVRNEIEKYEKLIHEKIQLLEERKGSPRSPLITFHREELIETPQTDERSCSRKTCIASVPRFMASTESSRQRQSANEQLNVRRITGTLCLSFSEPCMKPNMKRLKSRLAACEANSSVSKSIDSKSSFKKVSSISHQHRRRMSDFT